jgi:WD40 repeat protein
MRGRARAPALAWLTSPWLLLVVCAAPGAKVDAQTLRGHKDFVGLIAFSPDGKTLATGSFDKTIRLWDVKTGKEKAVLRERGPVLGLAFTPDGKALLAGIDGKETAVWDVAGRKEKARFRTVTESMALAVSPDGKSFVTGGPEHSVLLRDIKTGKEKLVFRGHTDLVSSAVFTRNGKVLITGPGDDTVRTWEVATGKELISLNRVPCHSMAASADGKVIATSERDKTVRLWDGRTGKELRSFESDDHAYLAAVSPDGKLLAVGSDGVVLLLDAAKLKLIKRLKVAPAGSAFQVLGLAFSPDGKTLAATGPDKGRGVRLWRTADVLPKPAKPGAEK